MTAVVCHNAQYLGRAVMIEIGSAAINSRLREPIYRIANLIRAFFLAQSRLIVYSTASRHDDLTSNRS